MAQARVIIVEDHREMARQMRRALEREWADLEVVDVPSAEEALLELLRGMPDLFIIDLGLPGLPGHEFIRRIRRVSPSLPILVTTAEAPEQVETLLQGLSVEGVFYKPFSLQSLAQKVGQLLRLGVDPLTEQLREIQEKFQARAVFIVDADASVVMAYGHPPERAEWESMRGAVLAMLSGGYRLSRMFDGGPSRTVHLCRNPQYVLLFRDLEGEYWLALWGQEGEAHNWSARLAELDTLADRLQQTLHQRLQGEGMPEAATPEEEVAGVEAVETLPEFSPAEIQPEEAERFWEEVLSQAEVEVHDPDALTYEEARSLGLIPEEPTSSENES